MILIDTHCHLYVHQFDRDAAEMVERAGAEGVKLMLMPAIDASEMERLLSFEARFPQCMAMMGLHPCSVKDNYEEELRVVEQQLKERSFVAIGETGLDFYWDLTYKEQQYAAFKWQIEQAIGLGLPVVIHSRNSTDECIEVVRSYGSQGPRGIFHCFSGTAAQARAITELGFYLGIGGVLTYKNSGLAEAVKDIPLEYIVLETDAPYLAPVPYRGKRNESSYIGYVARKLAEVKGVGVEELAAVTTANAQNIFRIEV